MRRFLGLGWWMVASTAVSLLACSSEADPGQTESGALGTRGASGTGDDGSATTASPGSAGGSRGDAGGESDGTAADSESEDTSATGEPDLEACPTRTGSGFSVSLDGALPEQNVFALESFCARHGCACTLYECELEFQCSDATRAQDPDNPDNHRTDASCQVETVDGPPATVPLTVRGRGVQLQLGETFAVEVYAIDEHDIGGPQQSTIRVRSPEGTVLVHVSTGSEDASVPGTSWREQMCQEDNGDCAEFGVLAGTDPKGVEVTAVGPETAWVSTPAGEYHVAAMSSHRECGARTAPLWRFSYAVHDAAFGRRTE